jgi:hypothetical protein
MANTFTSHTEKTLTHIYVRDAQNGFVRPCWATGTELYCGMCMRGTIQPVIGAVCPICSSTVERILEVAPGGAPKPVCKRRDCTIRMVRKDAGQVSSGVLRAFLD